MHYFDVLWRAGHQLHHGVARVDIVGDDLPSGPSIVQGMLTGLLAAGLTNSTAHAAAWAGLWGFCVALHQHWNVRTPGWTGWIIQRPEAHMLHHERDVHARNFGDMPVWDRIFGTYAEPVDRRSRDRVRARSQPPLAGNAGDGRRQQGREDRRPDPALTLLTNASAPRP